MNKSEWILKLAAYCDGKWLAIRDRLFFFTEEKNRKQMENIDLSLRLYEQIDARVKSGALPKRLANALVQNVASMTTRADKLRPYDPPPVKPLSNHAGEPNKGRKPNKDYLPNKVCSTPETRTLKTSAKRKD